MQIINLYPKNRRAFEHARDTLSKSYTYKLILLHIFIFELACLIVKYIYIYIYIYLFIYLFIYFRLEHDSFVK